LYGSFASIAQLRSAKDVMSTSSRTPEIKMPLPASRKEAPAASQIEK